MFSYKCRSSSALRILFLGCAQHKTTTTTLFFGVHSQSIAPHRTSSDRLNARQKTQAEAATGPRGTNTTTTTTTHRRPYRQADTQTIKQTDRQTGAWADNHGLSNLKEFLKGFDTHSSFKILLIVFVNTVKCF